MTYPGSRNRPIAAFSRATQARQKGSREIVPPGGFLEVARDWVRDLIRRHIIDLDPGMTEAEALDHCHPSERSANREKRERRALAEALASEPDRDNDRVRGYRLEAFGDETARHALTIDLGSIQTFEIEAAITLGERAVRDAQAKLGEVAS